MNHSWTARFYYLQKVGQTLKFVKIVRAFSHIDTLSRKMSGQIRHLLSYSFTKVSDFLNKTVETKQKTLWTLIAEMP
jgi:hypothetical protein